MKENSSLPDFDWLTWKNDQTLEFSRVLRHRASNLVTAMRSWAGAIA